MREKKSWCRQRRKIGVDTRRTNKIGKLIGGHHNKWDEHDDHRIRRRLARQAAMHEDPSEELGEDGEPKFELPLFRKIIRRCGNGNVNFVRLGNEVVAICG